MEFSMGSLTKFGSLWENFCVIQCGRCCVDTRGLKGFSRIFQRLALNLDSLLGLLSIFLGNCR